MLAVMHSSAMDFHKQNIDIVTDQPATSQEVCTGCQGLNIYKDDSETLHNDFKLLLKKYKRHMGDNRVSVVSGGLQQYLIKKSSEKGAQHESCMDQQDSIFHFLPVNVKLYIFSYLTPRELSRVSCVCQDWFVLTQDNMLWREILQREIVNWKVISHCTNPAVYKETQSEWSDKDIYLRCCPEVNDVVHEQNDMLSNITKMLRYFVPKKTPRIAMFGPGLESDNTSSIVRNLLNCDASLFQRLGHVPGTHGGVGSGVMFKMKSGIPFTLSVLYTASRQVRQQRGRDRLQVNSLVQQQQDEDGHVITTLKPAVKDFCRTVDAFVYVIDATKTANAVKEGNAELFAVVNERWSATNVPVLVLSCVQDSSVDKVPCVRVCEQLSISTMNRPWQVRNCESSTLNGLSEGLQWVVEQSQRQYS